MAKVFPKKEKRPVFCSSLSPPGLAWGYSRRGDENMSLCYGDVSHSLAHRIDFLKRLGIEYRDIVCAKQVHGSRLASVGLEDKGRGALSFETAFDATDGFVTDVPEVPLAVFSADCLVVFLYDPALPAVGLIHAGWRGTREHIIEKALELMKDTFTTKISNVHAAFGPAIRACCYEVGKEFLEYFPAHVRQRQGCNYLDLASANRQQLLDKGVSARNIFDRGVCTACENKKFYSHRKEAKGCGRMMSVIMLRAGGA